MAPRARALARPLRAPGESEPGWLGLAWLGWLRFGFDLALVWFDFGRLSAWFRLALGLIWLRLDFGLTWLSFTRILLGVGLIWLSFTRILTHSSPNGSHSSLGGPRTCYEFLGLATALIMDLLPFVTFPN